MMTTRIPSAQQQTYKAAKARYDSLNAQAATILGDTLPETDEEIDAYIEKEAAVHTELGIWDAWHALRKAEEELLAWGLTQAKKMPGYKNIIEEVIQTKNVMYRQKAIEIIMRIR